MKRTLIKIGIWILTLVSVFVLIKKTPLVLAALGAGQTLQMVAELAVVFVCLLLTQLAINRPWVRNVIMICIVYLYLWIHRAALPVLVSGLYVAALIMTGEAVTMLTESERPSSLVLRGANDFVVGSGIQIAITCLVNAFGIGGVACSRIIILITTAASLICILVFRYSKKRISYPMPVLPSEEEMKNEEKSYIMISIAIAAVITMLLLQAGRMNIALDYDSLHYGLRSPFVLDNGRGIYENLGSVNDVYVYPKALEVLAMPLNSVTTYGYVLSFSLWMAVMVLLLIYAIVRARSTRKNGLYAAMVASCIPGIMNMGISAKTDIITLAFQLIALFDIMTYLENGKDPAYLIFACAASIITYGFKPTSFLFTTLILVVGLVFVIINRPPAKKIKWPLAIAVLLPAVAALVGVTVRTMIITGLPVTATGASAFKALGFTVKYPFDSVISFGAGSDVLWKKMAALFFCPAGDFSIHIYIAWGSLAVTILIIAAVIKAIRKPKENVFLNVVFGVVLIASLVCIVTLWHVDGNYFMLLYALAVIAGFDEIRLTEMIPVLIMAVVMCVITNWAGTVGLTPIKLNHYGFYDHESDIYDRMYMTGNRDIYEYLNRDGTQRVLAMAEQPDCFGFRCNIQSYTDLEGSGGNVYLVKTLDYFKEFLEYAGTQYIYTNQAFLESHSRAEELVGYMIEDGSLEPVVDEGENILYRVVR